MFPNHMLFDMLVHGVAASHETLHLRGYPPSFLGRLDRLTFPAGSIHLYIFSVSI